MASVEGQRKGAHMGVQAASRLYESYRRDHKAPCRPPRLRRALCLPDWTRSEKRKKGN
jgi:hypothetical protein